MFAIEILAFWTVLVGGVGFLSATLRANAAPFSLPLADLSPTIEPSPTLTAAGATPTS